MSEYPAVSHTFVLREVKSLRRANFDIRMAAINSPDRPADGMTSEEQDESSTTFYVKREGIPGLTAGASGRAGEVSEVLFRRSLVRAEAGRDRPAAADFCGLLFRRSGHPRALDGVAGIASPPRSFRKRRRDGRTDRQPHLPDRIFLDRSRSQREFYDAPGLRLAEKIAGASFACCIGQFTRSQLMKLSPPDEWGKFEVARREWTPTFHAAPLSVRPGYV